MRCLRHDGEGVCEFGIADVPDELVPAVRRSGFTAGDGRRVRRFPAGTPRLDRAWVNFQRSVEPWLRQAAGLDPVPWADTLALVCGRLAGVDWWLTGSAALAVRGLAVVPGDLDLVVPAGAARRAVSGRRGLHDRVRLIDAAAG